MDTVCIPGFSQQELDREIILSAPLVTDVFPVVNRDDAHFGDNMRAGGGHDPMGTGQRAAVRVPDARRSHGFNARPGH